MRPALRWTLPASLSPGRHRALATVTALVAVAGIAAVSATSAEESEEEGAAVVAATDGPTTATRPNTPPTHDPAVRSDRSPLADAPIGEVERLADEQRLPSLSPEGPTASDDTAEADATGPVEATEDDAEPVYETADGERIDAARVFAFLDGRDAPLAPHAETIVAAGVRHDVDPRVVVAIAIAESNGAEMKPAGTHNAWGWGGNGPRGLRDWDSWEQSIDQYTERLGELYDTDDVDWDFASTYCPPNTEWWYDTVTWAIAQI